MAGDGVARKTTRFHDIVNGLAGEALSSHEASSRCGATSKSTGNMKSALEFGCQLTKNGGIDPVVFEMAMTRIAEPAVETKAGKEIGFPSMFPGAGTNDTVSKDPWKKEIAGQLWRGPAEVLGFGIVHREVSPKERGLRSMMAGTWAM